MMASLVFWAAVALTVYITVGYPLLLRLTAGQSGPAVKKDFSFQPTVSAIIAVYNGEAFLRAKLESILNLEYPGGKLDIWIVSDGSTDATEKIAREFASRSVKLLRQNRSGKAAALNLALTQAQGEILFLTDVRQQLHRDALKHLTANFADPSVGAVTGEMKLHSPDAGEQADMDLYWRYELWARAQHSRLDSLFNTTGCIYAIRRELMAPIPPDTLTDDAVIPLRAFFRGYRVIFDLAAIAYDQPAVGGTEFRRRWRTLAGLWQVHARLPVLFTAANRMRWHFLSHKFSRLLLPWALLALAVSIVFMPDSWLRRTCFAGELAVILLAALDALVPQGWLAKRLTSPVRTFLVMNVAALAALSVFFISPQVLWKPTRIRQ